jgi:uncharacterized damage-inducible protein DinB
MLQYNRWAAVPALRWQALVVAAAPVGARRPRRRYVPAPAFVETVMPRPSSRRPLDPGAALLRAYSASARINQYLVERLDPALWRATPPGGRGSRTIAALVAHMHNCGLRYLERTDPAARLPAELDRYRVTRAQATRALGAKRKAVLHVVGEAMADGRRIVGSPHDAAAYLAYYMSHDAHHRGQIVQLARMLGHPVSRDTMIGMWQWSARARE